MKPKDFDVPFFKGKKKEEQGKNRKVGSSIVYAIYQALDCMQLIVFRNYEVWYIMQISVFHLIRIFLMQSVKLDWLSPVYGVTIEYVHEKI